MRATQARNAQALRDFADGQPRQVLAEDFARVCRVMHCAHRRLILVIVKVVHEFHVVFDKPENYATGNTARVRGLNCGFIAPGRAADLVFTDRA